MTGLTPAILLAIMAIANAGFSSKTPTAICEVGKGRNLVTFGGTKEIINIPCKYNAIRATTCGDWKVTVTPGNVLYPKKSLYIIQTMWVGIERISDSLQWEGRSTRKTARQYLNGTKSEPFAKKAGQLNTEDVVKFEKGDLGENNENAVSLIAKNNQFTLTFGLFDDVNKKWDKTSGFSFKCYNKNFHPSSYPSQLCGNGTKKEVETSKKKNQFKGNRKATIIYNLFAENEGFVQTDSDCSAATRAISRKCKTKEDRYSAISLCWPIVGDGKYFRDVSKWGYSPVSAFTHCVEFCCSDFEDSESCGALAEEMEGAKDLPIVSKQIKKLCY